MKIDRRNFLKSSLVLADGLVLPSHLISFSTSFDGKEYDIVIYGATSGGIIAAVAAARKGKSVILVEPSGHLGGLTTGGLGATDIGIEGTIGGMSLEFHSQIRDYYRNEDSWKFKDRQEYMDRSGRFFGAESDGMVRLSL